jgi:hypothetical protein
MKTATKKPELDAEERALIATLKTATTQLNAYLDRLSCTFQCLEVEIGSTILLNSKAFAREERIAELSDLLRALIETICDKDDYPPHPHRRKP